MAERSSAVPNIGLMLLVLVIVLVMGGSCVSCVADFLAEDAPVYGTWERR